MIKLYSFLLIIFFSINTLAHQPRLNEEGDYAMSKTILILSRIQKFQKQSIVL